MKLRPRFRFVNFRSMLVVSASMCAAVFAGVLACASRPAGFALFSVLTAFFLGCALIVRRRRPAVPLTFVLSAVLSSVVFAVAFTTVEGWRPPLDYSAEHEISAVVAGVEMSDDMTVVLTDVEADGAKVKGNIRVYIESYGGTVAEFAKAGDKVGFSAKLYEAELTDGLKVNASFYRCDVRYLAYIDADDVTLEFGEQGLRDKLRTELHGALVGQLGDGYGDVAYGMLTGDKYALSDDIRDVFSVSGIGHILAVSGLHIGFLCALMLLLLKRARVSVRAGCTAAVLILYMLFVGFSPSVVRAVVMCSTGLATLINGRRRDGLSALCLSVSVILLFKPLSLYDVGFQMSVGAVFGMLTVSPLVLRALKRIRIPRFIAAPISVSFAAQAGVTPCMLYYFNTFSVYSVLTNVLLMPLITLVFVLLFVSALITAVIAPAAVLFKASGIFLWIMDAVASGVALIPYASVIVYSAAAVFVAYPLLFVAGDYFMLPRGKIWLTLAALIVCIVLFAVPQYGFVCDNSIIPVNAPGVNSIVSGEDGASFVGDFGDGDSVSAYMKKLKLKKLDAIYLTSLSENSAEAVADFIRTYRVGKVYIPDGEYKGLRTLFSSGADVIMLEQGDSSGGFEPLYNDGEFYGYSFAFESGKALFLGGDTVTSRLDENFAEGYSIIRSKVRFSGDGDRIYLTDFLAFGQTESQNLEFSRAETGDFAFNYLTGVILKAS